MTAVRGGAVGTADLQLQSDGPPLLQLRLALFGRWFFVVALAYYLIVNFPLDKLLGYPFSWWTEFFGPEEWMTLGTIACAAVVWLTARGRPLALRSLELLDAFGVMGPFAFMTAAVVWATPPRGEMHDIFTVLLGCTNLALVRAIVVPSTARRTLVVTGAAFVPVVAATVYAMAAATGVAPRTAENVAMTSALWAVVAVGSAAVTSRILFRLRHEVAEVRKLGQYTLQEKIGQGAAGIVYRADHVLLRRPTAIKLMVPSKSSESDLRRFEREVQQTARLTHPNTVAIYDYGRSESGVFYYAMEYIDGITLEELVRGHGPQPAWRVIHLLRQVCGALEEAHRVGLIHRDIKPANLMLCLRGGVPDVVKVLDFGLVKPIAPGSEASQRVADDIVGTPLYMSPEAIGDPGSLDHKSDLYALAATGYFLLTGTPVFSGASVVEICSKHLGQAPEPPTRRLGAPVPADLEEVLLGCLAKDPGQRPRTAADLARLLAACEAAGEWSAERVDPWWKDLRAATTSERLARPPSERLTVEIVRRRAP